MKLSLPIVRYTAVEASRRCPRYELKKGVFTSIQGWRPSRPHLLTAEWILPTIRQPHQSKILGRPREIGQRKAKQYSSNLSIPPLTSTPLSRYLDTPTVRKNTVPYPLQQWSPARTPTGPPRSARPPAPARSSRNSSASPPQGSTRSPRTRLTVARGPV